MWLPWTYAVALAVLCVAIARWGRWPQLSPVAVEAAIVLALYALWLRAGEFVPFGVTGGMERGRQVWRVQEWLHLPSEVSFQRPFLPHGWFIQVSNVYYAVAHVPAAIAMLVWLFFRHRPQYRVVRTTLAIVTAISLVMHYVPVAPPRLYPELGFVDTALLYHQSVYGEFGAGVSSQLAAMPSLHVAWAVLVGLVAWQVSPSRWRWVAVGHAIATVFVVTVTANHWWLDGVVGVVLLAPAFALAKLIAGLRARRTMASPSAPDRVAAESLA